MTTSDAMEALRAAVDRSGRVDFDGLVVERVGEGYAVETPDEGPTESPPDSVREVLVERREFVTNWRYWQETVGGVGTARRAFLRWVERAPIDAAVDADAVDADLPTARGTTRIDSVPDRYEELEAGIERRWGQLSITARLADDGPAGTRIYDLRHVDDVHRDATALETFDDPRSIRNIATYDADGWYRPLDTAPTLRTGWAVTDLTGEQLVRVVDGVYPATVANWHRERQGRLDVDHWTETAKRQTGIYGDVDDLPAEAIEWLAEACCVDSQCLRRREWELSEDAEIDVEGGDGRFPCREPCSLVIAAAREFARVESEPTKTVELEVTASELEQLTELVDAVADGRVGEIREAAVDDGANRYRARYFRAKHGGDGSVLPVRHTPE